VWTRLPTAACLVLCLLAPCASEAGEGDRSTPTIEALIERLGDADVDARQQAVDALVERGESSVPALLRAVREGRNHTRNGAAHALRRLGRRAAEAAQPLLVALRDEDEDLASAAAYALGGIARGDASLVHTLLDAVHTWNDFSFAAQALVGVGRAAVPDIVDALQRGNRPYRLRLLHYVLSQMGSEATDAIPALILLRQGSDVEVAQSAEEVLHGSHPDQAMVVGALVRSLESTNWEIRLLCVQQLGANGPKAGEGATGLAKRLKEDERPAIRKAAAQALSYVAPTSPETARALGAAIGDEDEQVAAMAVAALGAIGKQNAGAAETLEVGLSRPDPIGSAVRDALIECGESAVPCLVRGLGGTDESVRLRAARAAGEIGPAAAAAVPSLLRALRDVSEAVRAAAAEALGRIGPAAVPQLLETLDAQDLRLRIAAATALGEIGPDAAAAVPALGKALRDHDVELRRAAATALGLIGAASADFADELARALRDRNAAMRVTAATALGGLGPDGKPGVKALAKAARDKDETLAVAAVDALGKIGPAAEAAVGHLLWCLHNAPAEVMWRSARTLGLIHPHDRKVVKALADALLCPDWRVREFAAVALGAIGPYAAEARKDLEKLATDGRAEVREAARDALQRLDAE